MSNLPPTLAKLVKETEQLVEINQLLLRYLQDTKPIRRDSVHPEEYKKLLEDVNNLLSNQNYNI